MKIFKYERVSTYLFVTNMWLFTVIEFTDIPMYYYVGWLPYETSETFLTPIQIRNGVFLVVPYHSLFSFWRIIMITIVINIICEYNTRFVKCK